MTSDWPFILGGVFTAILVVPSVLYVKLVVDPISLSGLPLLLLGTIAMLPGFVMGGLGLWTAARG